MKPANLYPLLLESIINQVGLVNYSKIISFNNLVILRLINFRLFFMSH
jgi:hypothetical protein